MISTQTIGTGQKAIFLLHGFLENRGIWKFLCDDEHLQKKFRFYLIDYLGHGTAPKVHEAINSFEPVARQLEQLITTENLTSSAIIGHSMGGYVALECLSLFPEKLSGICLYHSTSHADSVEKQQTRLQAAALLRSAPGKFIAASIPGLFHPNRKAELAAAIENSKAEALKTDPESAAISVLAMKNRPSHAPLLEQYPSKIWYIGGEADPLFSAEQVQSETALLPKDHIFMLPNSGHMSYAEEPAAAKMALESVLNGS